MDKRKSGSLIMGLILVIVGGAYLGNIFEWWSFTVFFDGWWSLFILVPCMISIFDEGLHVVNVLGVVIGALLLLDAQGVLRGFFGWEMILPIVLITIGGSLIFKKNQNTTDNRETHYTQSSEGSAHGEEQRTFYAVFGSNNPNFRGEVFRGADLNAIFGSVDLTLYDSIISSDVTINVHTIFGGTDIRLPRNVKVKVEGTPIFGGIDNEYINSGMADAPTVHIHAVCLFGGIDIK